MKQKKVEKKRAMYKEPGLAVVVSSGIIKISFYEEQNPWEKIVNETAKSVKGH